MTPAQFIALNPIAFKETLERRVDELSDRVHTLTTELAILQRELRLLSRRPQVITRGQGGTHGAGNFGVAGARLRSPVMHNHGGRQHP